MPIENINISIMFSNFYKHYIPVNWQGLYDLLKNGIRLVTFTNDIWTHFLEAAELQSMVQCHEQYVVSKRQKRDMDDKLLLQYLEGSRDLEYIIQYLENRKITVPKLMK